METALNGTQLKFIVCKIDESVAHREITRSTIWILSKTNISSSDIWNAPKAGQSAAAGEPKIYRKGKEAMSVMNTKDAGEFVNEHYRKVAARWRARVTDSPFMQQLRAGTLPREALTTFFKNWGSCTSIEINTVEAASYHKHISFFRKHRDLMARMAEKLADELIHPKPPGHVHVVVETAKALGITEDEIFLAPMLAEFRAKLDFKRSLLWEGTIAEFYAAGATEEQTGYWSADFLKR